MANPQKGEVPLVVGGRHYTLVLNTNAIATLEAVLSTGDREVVLSDVLFSMARGSHRYTRAFVWACLRRDHKEITLDQTGELIDAAGGPEALFAALADLKRSATPDPDDERLVKAKDKSRPRAPRRTRGTGAGLTSTRGASG
jgi:hypothetical protein